MYDLPYHKEKNDKAIIDFIKKYPFAFLTGCDSDNRPVVTQVPIYLEIRDGKNFLRGHLMKSTDHHKAFLQNENALVVFTGKHTYVSGTWYKNPNSASTWNYMSVHARGTVRFLDETGLEDVLRKTSLLFEDQDPQSETVFDNLPQEFRKKAVKAIDAFEIEIKEINTVFKLSQEKDAISYRNIINKLKDQDEDGRAIAAEMEKREKELFP